MTNGERYKDDILACAYAHNTCGAFYNSNNKLIVQGCSITPCKDCIFYNGGGFLCKENFIKWVNQPYIDVNWEGVPIDTKVLVSHDGKKWIGAHFAKYVKSSQLIGAWMYGKTSFTVSDKHNIEYYSYAKLYKGDENNG